MRRNRIAKFIAILGALAMLAAACGSDSGGDDGGGEKDRGGEGEGAGAKDQERTGLGARAGNVRQQANSDKITKVKRNLCSCGSGSCEALCELLLMLGLPHASHTKFSSVVERRDAERACFPQISRTTRYELRWVHVKYYFQYRGV